MAKDENKKIKKENKNGLKNLKLELKKVVWPTPKQLANNTIAVITIVLITAVIVFGLDFAFEKANEYGWHWEEVVGKHNGINEPGLSSKKGGEPGSMRSLIASTFVFKDELYVYNFDQILPRYRYYYL